MAVNVLIPAYLGAHCHIPQYGSLMRFGVLTAVFMINQIWHVMMCNWVSMFPLFLKALESFRMPDPMNCLCSDAVLHP